MKNKIQLFLTKIKMNSFWKSVTSLVSGSIIAHGISLLTTPIVSRLYSTVDFGYHGLIVSSASIIIGIVTFGLSSAIMAPKLDEDADLVLSVSVILSVVTTILLMAALLISYYFFKFSLLNINDNLGWVALFFLIILTNLSGQLSVYTNRKKMNRVLFYNVVIGAVVTLIVTIPLGVLRVGGIGLTIAAIISSFFQIVQMVMFAKPKIRIPSVLKIKNVFSKYIDFVRYQYPSNFISNFAYQLPAQAFSLFYGGGNLGLVNMSDKLLGIPARLVAGPIGTIYFRTASENFREGKNFSDFTFKLVISIMIVALVPLLILIVWGTDIFSFVLGAEWEYAGKISSYLGFVYIMYFCETVTSYCRVAIGRQKANLIVSIVRLIITALSLAIGIFVFKTFLLTVVSFSVGISLYLIIDMFINFYYLGKNKYKYLIFSLIYLGLVSIFWLIFW